MTPWSDYVRKQARLIIAQISDIQNRAAGADECHTLTSRYYEMLEQLYDRDLQLARLRDNSDLLLRADGSAFSDDPKLHLVSSIFANVTSQVTDLTKAIIGVRTSNKIKPGVIDLGLTGIARGSLYFGLTASVPDVDVPLLGDIDSLHDSTLRALKIIDEVSHTIEGDDEQVSIPQVSEVVDDPRVRDAALVAIQRIAPTGRRGFSTLSVSGSASSPAELTPLTRKAIRESLDTPVIHGTEIAFTGHVREIDLDAHRFELRGIADEEVRDLRCAYRAVTDVNPRKLLGARVRVRGLVERASNGVPRLMAVQSLEITHEAVEHPV